MNKQTWKRSRANFESLDFMEEQPKLTSRMYRDLQMDTQVFFEALLRNSRIDSQWLIENDKDVRYVANAILGEYKEMIEEIVDEFLNTNEFGEESRMFLANKRLDKIGRNINEDFHNWIDKDNKGNFLSRLIRVKRVTWERADKLYLAFPFTSIVDKERLTLYVNQEILLNEAKQNNRLWLFESELQEKMESVFLVDFVREEYEIDEAKALIARSYKEDNEQIIEVNVPESTYNNEPAYASRSVYDQLKVFFQRVVDIQREGLEMQDERVEELDKVNQSIEDTESQLGFRLSPEQHQAVHAFWQNSIFLLSGEAGSGKTTTVRAIVKSVRDNNPEATIFGASLTGRASHNLSRVANLKDKEWGTLHKLRAVNTFGGNTVPTYDEIDLLIVEEFSMVELNLFTTIIHELRDDVKILFVGDMEQLPPIDIGFSYDFTESSISEWLHLTEIQRQDKEGVLYKFINGIREDTIDENLLTEGVKADYTSDFRYITSNNTQDTIDHAIREYMRFIRTSENEFNNREAQLGLRVLASTNKVVDSVNRGVQQKLLEWSNLLDTDRPYTTFNNQNFYIGDRIAINSNIAGTYISNGMTGTIVDFETKDDYASDLFGIEPIDTNEYIRIQAIRQIMVKFDDLVTEEDDGIRGLSTYDFNTLGNFKLGYATTIHKAQGLTLNKVIVGFVYNNFMNSKQLLYTSISRPDEQLVLISSTYVLREAVTKNDYEKARPLYKAILPEIT